MTVIVLVWLSIGTYWGLGVALMCLQSRSPDFPFPVKLWCICLGWLLWPWFVDFTYIFALHYAACWKRITHSLTQGKADD